MAALRVKAAALPRTARLLAAADFAACFKARQRLAGRYFALNLHPNTAGCARLGLAVSRKVDTRAVVRNRIKRCVRESFRRCAMNLPALDLVFTAKREAAAQPNIELRADIEALFNRLSGLPLSAARGTMRADSAGPSAPASNSV